MSADGNSKTSPAWVWGTIFAVVAIGAVMAIGPKYQWRSTKLKQQQQARETGWVNRLKSESSADGPSRATADEAAEAEFARRQRLVVQWLAGIIIVGGLVVAGGVYCALRPQRSVALQESKQSSDPVLAPDQVTSQS